MSNHGSPNRLEFAVEPIPYFVKAIVAALSMIIYVPAAEQLTQLLQYVTSKLKFADGTTVSYTGTVEALKQPTLPVTIVIWASIILNVLIGDPLIRILVSVGTGLASGYVAYQLIKVIAPLLVTNHGSRLEFSGTIEEYLKWQLILLACSSGPALVAMLLPQRGFLGALASIFISLVTVVLIASVLIPYSQWFVSRLTGGSRVGRFDANPVEMILMYVGFVLFSLLIVTIPWSIAWFMKWWMSRYSLPARTSVPVGSGYPV